MTEPPGGQDQQWTMTMTKRPLGATGLEVTSLCLGCAPLGSMTETFGYAVSEEQAKATLRAAFRSPITFIDTAASYGDGESERRIGLVLRELGGVPEGYVIATKADRDSATGEFSGRQMRRSVERSLRLLGLDHLPLVYLHDPEHASFDTITAPGGALQTLQDMQREGIIGALGVAGGPVDLMIRYVELGAFTALITHNRYNLLNRSAGPLLDIAAQRGLGVCNAAPYGSGILAKGPDQYARFAYREATESLRNAARQYQAVCDDFGVPLAAVALQFSLRDPRITSTIVGMSRPERIEQTLELAAIEIPDALWTRISTLPYSLDDPEHDRET